MTIISWNHFQVIMIEVGNPIWEPKSGQIHQIMTANGYCLYDRTKIDLVYAHSQHTNFCDKTKIRYPEDFKEFAGRRNGVEWEGLKKNRRG